MLTCSNYLGTMVILFSKEIKFCAGGSPECYCAWPVTDYALICWSMGLTFPSLSQLWLWAEGLLLLCTWWISVLMFHHEHFFSRSIDASWWSHCTTRGQSSAWSYHGVQEVELNPSLLFHCTVLPWFSQILVVFHTVEIYVADSSCWAEMSNMAISAFRG